MYYFTVLKFSIDYTMSPIVCGLFLACVIVYGLKFPGKCPKVPHTHYPEEKTIQMQIVYGTSFPSGRPSYLFRSFNIIQEQYIFSVYMSSRFQDVCFLETYYTENMLLCSVRANISTFDVTKDKSLVLTSSLFHRYDLTWLDQKITEEVHMWFVDECLILWSCKNNESDKSHDPALVLMVPWQEEFSLEEYRAWMKNISVTSKLFLSNSSILETIDWGLNYEKTRDNTISTDCKDKQTFFGGPTIDSGKYEYVDERSAKSVEKLESVEEKNPMILLLILGIILLLAIVVVFVIVYKWKNDDGEVEPPSNTDTPVRRAWEVGNL